MNDCSTKTRTLTTCFF